MYIKIVFTIHSLLCLYIIEFLLLYKIVLDTQKMTHAYFKSKNLVPTSIFFYMVHSHYL